MTINSPKMLPGLLAAIFAVLTFTASPALAAGGTITSTITPKCKKGKIWNRKMRKCVRIKKSSLLDDEDIYQTGRDLAIRKRFEDAILVLSYSSNKNDPRVLNYLGYAHRKAGRIEVGLGYYKAALRIDPDYTLVREYLGEAFLQKGDLKNAKIQLNEIEKRCGSDCAEYAELSQLIANFRLN